MAPKINNVQIIGEDGKLLKEGQFDKMDAHQQWSCMGSSLKAEMAKVQGPDVAEMTEISLGQSYVPDGVKGAFYGTIGGDPNEKLAKWSYLKGMMSLAQFAKKMYKKLAVKEFLYLLVSIAVGLLSQKCQIPWKAMAISFASFWTANLLEIVKMKVAQAAEEKMNQMALFHLRYSSTSSTGIYR